MTSLSEQIRDFEHVTLPALESELGCSRTDLLPRYLFVVGVGGNDIVFNYFLKGAFPRVDLRTFVADLITTLSKHLQVNLMGNSFHKIFSLSKFFLNKCRNNFTFLLLTYPDISHLSYLFLYWYNKYLESYIY